MIVDLFFAIIGFMLKIIDWLTPNWNLPNNISYAFAIFFDRVIKFNEFFPTIALVKCLSVVFTFNLMIIITNYTVGIISLLRGGGGEGAKS